MLKKYIQGLLLALVAFISLGTPVAAQAQTQPPPPSQPGSPGSWWNPFVDEARDDKKGLDQWKTEFSMPSACWGCDLFAVMAGETLKYGNKGEEMFKGPAIAAMNAFMALWVTLQLYLLLSPSHAVSPSQTINSIFQRCVIMIIVLFILKQGSFDLIMGDLVFPIIGGIMQSAVQLIPSAGAGCGTSFGGGAPAEAAELIRQGTNLMCAMHIEMGKGMGLGAFLIDDADFGLAPPRFEFIQIIGGAIVFLAFMAMLVMLPFRLFDALIRLTVVSVILPLVVLAYQFKPTRGAVKQAATSVLAAGLTFFFTALAVAVSVSMLNEVTKGVLDNVQGSTTGENGFVGPLGGRDFMILVASAIGMAAFIKQAGTIAGEFAGFAGSMGNVGAAGGMAAGATMTAAGGGAGVVAGRAMGKVGSGVAQAGKAAFSRARGSAPAAGAGTGAAGAGQAAVGH